MLLTLNTRWSQSRMEITPTEMTPGSIFQESTWDTNISAHRQPFIALKLLFNPYFFCLESAPDSSAPSWSRCSTFAMRAAGKGN